MCGNFRWPNWTYSMWRYPYVKDLNPRKLPEYNKTPYYYSIPQNIRDFLSWCRTVAHFLGQQINFWQHGFHFFLCLIAFILRLLIEKKLTQFSTYTVHIFFVSFCVRPWKSAQKTFFGYSRANLFQIFENDSDRPAYVFFGYQN